MTALIPNRFLFSFEWPLAYRAKAPTIDGRLTGWTDAELLPRMGDIDGTTDFGQVWACWNETGLFVACRVSGKTKPLRCDPARFWQGDNLRLCTDMRDARTVKRGTRFCQQFFFLPTGGGADGRRAAAGTNKLQRARDDAPAIDENAITVASRVRKTGYSLEAHVPASCLNGFDPTEHPRIGLYYILEDTELGQQYLTVGDDLYWHIDPSTWPTAVLAK